MKKRLVLPNEASNGEQNNDYLQDLAFGERLLIHCDADKREVHKNILAACVILGTFLTTMIRIRPHRLEYGVKNPEYEIDGLLADRKGIESEKGIKWGFISAIKQGCKVVVIDLNDRMYSKPLRINTISKMIRWRRKDFEQGKILRCYIVYHCRAIVVENEDILDLEQIRTIIKKLKP